jgi:glutamine synthetase
VVLRFDKPKIDILEIAKEKSTNFESEDEEAFLLNPFGDDDFDLDDAWVREAKKRGLLNLKNTAEALPYFLDTKNRLLFTKHKVHTELEMESRYEVLMENYCKVLHIEALTMIDMAKKDIFPSVLKYLHEIANTANALKTFLPQAKLKGQERIARTLALLFDQADEQLQSLEKEVDKTKDIEGVTKTATYYAEKIIPAMNALRESCDEMECLTSKEHWPFPSYADLLFRV